MGHGAPVGDGRGTPFEEEAPGRDGRAGAAGMLARRWLLLPDRLRLG
jgi:hypothetical protein